MKNPIARVPDTIRDAFYRYLDHHRAACRSWIADLGAFEDFEATCRTFAREGSYAIGDCRLEWTDRKFLILT